MDCPPDDSPCEVTITAPDRKWLQAFVRQLVEDRLAAAAHVDTMQTTYRWAAQVHENGEARAIVHTTLAKVAEIAQHALDEHPYEVPCVVAKPIVGGVGTYLDWIRSTTG